MSDQSERYRKLAAQFSERVRAVPADAWDNPAPPEGWVARDVIGHLAEWIPGFFGSTYELEIPPLPSLADDPAGVWAVLDATVQGAFDDPEVAGRQRDTPMGTKSFEELFDMIGTADVFMHTWDLARATGLDETLDPDEVHHFLVSMEPMDQMMRDSGQFGPRIPVPDDADEQTRLIAFIGRQP